MIIKVAAYVLAYLDYYICMYLFVFVLYVDASHVDNFVNLRDVE